MFGFLFRLDGHGTNKLERGRCDDDQKMSPWRINDCDNSAEKAILGWMFLSNWSETIKSVLFFKRLTF